MNLGENIRYLRAEAGLTQQDLAERLGIARSTINQWECNTSAPRADRLQGIADVLDVPCADLVAENLQRRANHKSAIPLLSMAELIQLAHHLSPEEESLGCLEYSSIQRTTEVPRTILARHANALGLLVEDNAMELVAPRGLTWIFDPSLAPTNGRIAVVRLAPENIVVRRLFRSSKNVILAAEGREEQLDIVLPLDAPIRVLGTVVWLQSPYELA